MHNRLPRRVSAYSRLLTLSVATSSLFAMSSCAVVPQAQQTNSTAIGYAERLPEDEIIYFVLPDRFANGDTSNDTGQIEGDRLKTGFDITHKGFYHGGDLKGLQDQLDYIQGLGVTAIWLTPVFKNKAVQGPPGNESSGYHGYWITDFLDIDPHIGSREEFKNLVDAAHARGMKVYMDIISNHTADVIKYEECQGSLAPAALKASDECPYRPLAQYPYTTKGRYDGQPTNSGFLGDDKIHQTAENFARLTDPDFAYNVYIPKSEKNLKNPAWLNDPIYYHNRGHTTFRGEDSLYGDFAGLDDLMTEHPRVVEGFKDIYSQWIKDFRVDGFRIDTVKHVNAEFWQQLIPTLMETAKEEGIEHFHIFGEVYEFDPGQLAVFTQRDGLPAVLDFAFQGSVHDFVVKQTPGENLKRLFAADHVYTDDTKQGRRLPTFLGNHDMGRFAGMLKAEHPDMSDDEMLARLKLANAIMMFSRGVPTIYYGDEQGFVSDGGDQAAREDMFESQVDSYNDNDLVGNDRTTADRNFDTSHPLYVEISKLANLRQNHAALRRGEQIVRYADLEKSTFVISRLDPDGQYEYIAAFNAADTAQDLVFSVNGNANSWESLSGTCPTSSAAVSSVAISLPPTGYVLCRAALGTK